MVNLLGACSVLGDGHFITFDNKAFQAKGTCEYVIAKDCSSSRLFEVLKRSTLHAKTVFY